MIQKEKKAFAQSDAHDASGLIKFQIFHLTLSHFNCKKAYVSPLFNLITGMKRQSGERQGTVIPEVQVSFKVDQWMSKAFCASLVEVKIQQENKFEVKKGLSS